MKIDLHLHSCYSGDGIHSVDRLTSLFSTGDVIALTDHETIAGWEDFEISCKQRNLRPIYGVEWFTSPYHIISYFPCKKVSKQFNSFIIDRRFKEGITMKALALQIKKDDDHFSSYDDLIKMKPHPENILGMTVTGCKLKKLKNISFKEAISILRNRKHEIPECPETFYTEDLISKMSNWGALNILAHPFRNVKSGQINYFEFANKIKAFKDAGLNGVELHPFQDEWNKHIIEICKRFDLIWTIGSDYHHYKEGIYPKKLPELNGSITSGLSKLHLI